ncbi:MULTISPECIES: hypothetical protein [unclassified Streptomyces]|uniref:hypothetical protein n=1 Tax=unclassified Streptomyces TaxID=2593676 RepID=UPI000DAC8A77|nr:MULTISPECIES: hypothetical protein [unclassified Streptomyces]PZT77517.1 hypothetical protein DNK56_30535 [Streptomyces sp. AC1-42W]PZT78528.1 hypothetical protein DNK55_02145 [Streptomyces sp. AC1-42T]
MTEPTPVNPADASASTPGFGPVPPVPSSNPVFTAPVPPLRSRKTPLLAIATCAALLAGAAGFWWGSRDDSDSLGPLRSVDISAARLVEAEADEDCDDYDDLSYNDCDAETTYKFKYKIRNEGDEIASYSAVINAFDEDGNFIGQDYISVSHLAPGKTKSDENEFGEYSNFEGDNKPSDIAVLRVAHVERTALAN